MKTPSDGASDATQIATPNTMPGANEQVAAAVGPVGRRPARRRARPRPSRSSSSCRRPALPSNVILAISGSTTGELMANVPTTSVSSRIERSSGVCHDVAQAVAHLALLAPERRVAVQLAGAASSAARR